MKRPEGWLAGLVVALVIVLSWTVALANEIDVLASTIDRASLPPVAPSDTIWFWDSGLVGMGCRLIAGDIEAATVGTEKADW